MYPSPGQSVKSSRYGVQPIAMPISFRPPAATRKRPTQKIKKQMPAAAPCSAAFASGLMCLLQGVFQSRLRSAGRGKRNWYHSRPSSLSLASRFPLTGTCAPLGWRDASEVLWSDGIPSRHAWRSWQCERAFRLPEASRPYA